MTDHRTVTHQAQSRHYSERLGRYLRRVVNDSGQFCCSAGERCQRSIPVSHGFAAGQLTYVGSRYSTTVDDKAFRVLVVSMQNGDSEAPVTMTRRAEQVAYRIPQVPKDRNPHMRGVTYALQYLFGLNPLSDGEYLGDHTHVLDAYAMANSTLCSHLPTGSSSRRGEPTVTMLKECCKYLKKTIEILEPTVIHSQGRKRSPDAASTHLSIEWVADHLERIDEWNARIRVGEVESIWCSLPHPSSGPPQAWQWLRSPFHHEVAAPALRAARMLALKI